MPPVLILNEKEVEELLPMHECIAVMEDAFRDLAREQFFQPLRTIVRAPGASGVMALMPTFRGGAPPRFGLKAICVFPGNAAIGKDAHQGAVLLFNGETGELEAMVNASAITSIRTAAVSGLATRLLANKEAAELAVIGSGVQARAHLEAIACVRPLRHARIASRHFENSQALAGKLQGKFDFPLTAAANAEAAIRDADIIVTATTSREPVVKLEWIKKGAHINAIGTFSPKAREIDGATMAASSLFVDRRESAVNEAGDYRLAVEEGSITKDHIRAELSDLVTGASPGRTSAVEITIFKSLGIAIEDLAAAAFVYEKATRLKAGRMIEF